MRILPGSFLMNGGYMSTWQCEGTSDFVIRGYTFWLAAPRFHPWIPLVLPGGCHMVLVIYLYFICQSGSWALTAVATFTSLLPSDEGKLGRPCIRADASCTGSVTNWSHDSPSRCLPLVTQNNLCDPPRHWHPSFVFLASAPGLRFPVCVPFPPLWRLKFLPVMWGCFPHAGSALSTLASLTPSLLEF